MYYYIPFVVSIVGMVFALAVVGHPQYYYAKIAVPIFLGFWLLEALVFVGAFGGTTPRGSLENWRLPGWALGAKLALNIPFILLFLFVLGITLWRAKRRGLDSKKLSIINKLKSMRDLGFLGLPGIPPNTYRNGRNQGSPRLDHIVEDGEWPFIVKAIVCIRRATGYPKIADYLSNVSDSDSRPYDRQIPVRIGQALDALYDHLEFALNYFRPTGGFCALCGESVQIYETAISATIADHICEDCQRARSQQSTQELLQLKRERALRILDGPLCTSIDLAKYKQYVSEVLPAVCLYTIVGQPRITNALRTENLRQVAGIIES